MSHIQRLPSAEIDRLKVGFMRLTDSAPLILAHEAGLFEQYGLDVQLVREVSWANLRDRLAVGELDAAQLLAPLPIATMLGAGGIRGNLLTGLSLGLNGNAITLSNRLFNALGATYRNGLPDPMQIGRAIKSRGSGAPPLNFATVHAFSMHTFLLRVWLQAAGVDPDHDIRMLVLPPEQMCDSLARGIIDGFCVGEPWSSVAVAQGIGSVACTGYQIWNNAPEKVLGVTEGWHERHPGTHLRLRLAVMAASRQLRELEARERVANIMSRPEYLNLPEKVLLPSLTGLYCFSRGQPPVSLPDFHVFWDRQAGFPWRSHAQWIVQQTCDLLGRAVSAEQMRKLVHCTWRTDLYREAARILGEPCPASDYKPEDAHPNVWELEPGIILGADMRISSLPPSAP